MAYAFKRTCSVDHSQCGASDSTDFPVSVVFTSTTMKPVGSGGHINNTVTSHGQTVPADLAFFSDSGLTTLLNFEIESYDSTAGTIVAWVKIPTLSHTADTLFYMGYDDAAVVTFQGNVTGTWNSGFKGVYHLADGTTLNLLDSTSGANTLTNHNSTPAASGQIDGAAIFDGNADDRYLSATAGFGGITALTASFWTIATPNSGSQEAIISKGTGGFQDFIVAKATGGDNNKIIIYLQNSIGGNTGNLTTTAVMFDLVQAPHHFAVTWDGTTVQTYVDAVADVTGLLVGTLDNSDTVLAFGALSTAGGGFFNGTLDEFELSNVARSADWLTATVNNQKVSQTMLSVGTETPTGGGTAYTLTANAGSYSVTGSSVTLKAARTLAVSAGSYTVTGSAVTLTKSSGPVNYTITADPGSYVIIGSRVRLIWSGAPVGGTFPQAMAIAIMGL